MTELLTPANAGLLLVLAIGAVTLVVFGLRRPELAMLYLLAAMFLRLALPRVIADPFLLAFAGLLAAVGLWLSVHPGRLPRLGWLEGAMALYLLWNIYSMFAPHTYGAVYPLSGDTLSVYRFILTGTAIPFACYLIGRTVYRSEMAVRVLLWAVIGFGAYSALVSIGQFYAPSLVWPRYIVDAPLWPGRANGVFNQPVVNGLALIAGFVAALIIAQVCRITPRWAKTGAVVGAVAMAFGVYLTHTRAIWLCFLVALIAGAVLGKRVRTGFLISLGVIVVAIAANWSTFTSSDRERGGVGSVNEIDDRLNSAATSFWAIQHHPITGWGIGRFTAVNSLHHQQWSPDVPWIRGLGISSHFNELGIMVELGAIGIVLWLAVLVLLIVRLVRAIKTLPDDGLCGRNLGLLAAMLLGTLIVSGLTVDLRFFDFPNALVYLLAGIAVGWSERAPAPAEVLPRVERLVHV